MEEEIDETPEEDSRPEPFTGKLADGTVIRLPSSHLSPSAVGMYVKCPRQFWFRYVEGLKIPPDIALVAGLAGHDALAANNRERLTGKPNLPKKAVIEKFRDSLSERAGDLDVSEARQKDAVGAEIVPSLAAYMDEMAGRVVPTAVEQPMRLSVEGIPVLGYADLLTKAGRVVDYKFCSKRSPYRNPEYVRQSLQLSIYAMAFRTRKVGHVCVVKGADLAESVTHTRKDQDIQDAREQVVHVARGVSAGAFPLCPEGSWYCGPKWCGYWSRCRGRGESTARKGA